MPRCALAGNCRVEIPPFVRRGLDVSWNAVEHFDLQPDFVPVVTVFGPFPDHRPRLRIQHVPERRHRAIMKIRGAGPDPIQRWRHIACRIDFDRIIAKSADPAILDPLPMTWSQSLQPDRVGLDFIQVDGLLLILAPRTVSAVATSAVLTKNRFPPRGQILVDFKRVLGWI